MDELEHHGILGMHWGVRRYQNKDGTLTSAGKARLVKKDEKWIKKNSDKITDKARTKSSKELSQYAKDLMRNQNAVNKSGKLSASTINAYNRKMAELMSQKVSGLQSPSGRVVQFVAKRGEVGVFMALADQGYNMERLKNGVWTSGRVAYKNESVDVAHSEMCLCHHGIKGMKWGVRRTPEQLGHLKKSELTTANNYDIIDTVTGTYFHLAEDTKISNPTVFAGKGTSHKLKEDVAIGLSEQLGGKPENWQHCKGDGIVDYYGEERKAEIHWFQEETVGKHKFKIKKWLEE